MIQAAQSLEQELKEDDLYSVIKDYDKFFGSYKKDKEAEEKQKEYNDLIESAYQMLDVLKQNNADPEIIANAKKRVEELISESEKCNSRNVIYKEVINDSRIKRIEPLLSKIGIGDYKFPQNMDSIDELIGEFEKIENAMIEYAKEHGQFYELAKKFVRYAFVKNNGKHWMYVKSHKNLPASRVAKLLGMKSESKLVRMLMYELMKNQEGPKWFKSIKGNLDELQGKSMAINELKEKGFNHYAIKYLIKAGLMEKKKRGVYRVRRFKNDDKEFFEAANSFIGLIRHAMRIYLEPFRSYSLNKEGMDEELKKAFGNAVGNIKQKGDRGANVNSLKVIVKKARKDIKLLAKAYEAHLNKDEQKARSILKRIKFDIL